MSTAVYILAGAEPTLWAYPSQVHPASPSTGVPVPGTRRFTYPPRLDHPYDDETALAVLGAI